MRSQLVAPVLKRVRARGGEVGKLVRAFGLPKTVEQDAEVVLPLSRFRALLEAAEAEAKDPFLGAHVAASVERGTYGILEFSCTSAPTVGEALRRVVRYMSLLNEIVDVTLVERGREALVEQKIPGEPLCVGRHANEFFIAYLVVQFRRLTGSPYVPSRAWFAHPAPRDRSELEALLGTDRLEFGREANGLALPREGLAVPLRTSDPPLLALLDEKAAEALKQRGGTNRFLGQLKQALRDRLSTGVPSVSEAAQALGMSARTLQRRLDDEGTTFQALVDGVREELARYYLRDGTRPLGEVAYLCGYSELSAFLRAFKRWTKQTPSEFRAR
jgi:AraC-like DNA-binding protein